MANLTVKELYKAFETAANTFKIPKFKGNYTNSPIEGEEPNTINKNGLIIKTWLTYSEWVDKEFNIPKYPNSKKRYCYQLVTGTVEVPINDEYKLIWSYHRKHIIKSIKNGKEIPFSEIANQIQRFAFPIIGVDAPELLCYVIGSPIDRGVNLFLETEDVEKGHPCPATYAHVIRPSGHLLSFLGTAVPVGFSYYYKYKKDFFDYKIKEELNIS